MDVRVRFWTGERDADRHPGAAYGVSERLLRYYDEQGLLEPSRLPSGYRLYAETDVATVRHIRTLLKAGLNTHPGTAPPHRMTATVTSHPTPALPHRTA